MIAARTLSMMLFQGGDAAGSDHSQLLVYSVVVIAFCSLVQFLVFAGAGIFALKEWKKLQGEIEGVKHKAFPLIANIQEIVKDATPKVKSVTASVQQIVTDMTPKVKTISTNVEDISNVARSKVHEFEATLDKANETVRAANEKTRAQVDRVDGMVSSALKTTSDVSNTIQRGIRAPVVEVAGLVKGVKAALDVLIGRAEYPSGSSRRNTADRRYAPGPQPVVPSDRPASSHPSSNVAPSPGAAAVVDRMRDEKVKTIY